MIPQTVKFSGLTVNAREILFPYNQRKVPTPFKSEWIRVELETDQFNEKILDSVDSWLCKNIEGRWGSYELLMGQQVVVVFENEHDAIIFKLMDGPTACLQSTLEQ